MIPNTSTKHTPLKFEASYVFSDTIKELIISSQIFKKSNSLTQKHKFLLSLRIDQFQLNIISPLQILSG